MKDICPFSIVLFVNFLLIFGCVESKCQVINDNIENRLELKMNEPLQSTTTDCTLQWGCLNHALTKKLIQYHNDQWFYFKTTNLDKYYINISKQECRDLRGVQLMVIHGKPCEPESYDIVKYVTLGDHNDIFIALDSLGSFDEYLVLIDGYLHDFCVFEIEFSDTPKGLPIVEKGILPMNFEPIVDLHFDIYWHIPDTVAKYIRRYEVYRRNDFDFKSKKIHEIEQEFNSRGVPLQDYVYEEFLPDYGVYHYAIIGIGDHDRQLISKKLLSVDRPGNYFGDAKNWLEVDLYYPKACKLKISVYNASNQSLLNSYDFNYNIKNRLFKANIKEYKERGIFYYRIEIVNEDTNEKRSHLQMK